MPKSCTLGCLRGLGFGDWVMAIGPAGGLLETIGLGGPEEVSGIKGGTMERVRLRGFGLDALGSVPGACCTPAEGPDGVAEEGPPAGSSHVCCGWFAKDSGAPGNLNILEGAAPDATGRRDWDCLGVRPCAVCPESDYIKTVCDCDWGEDALVPLS